VELGSRESEENRRLGVYAASRCDMAVVVGEHNREAICEGLLEGGLAQSNTVTVKTVEEALKILPAGSKTVLLLNDLPDNYL
jgi:UDP-N-acetylmuramoyl-tripeptide--D-alanyl-D-alanine ligase